MTHALIIEDEFVLALVMEDALKQIGYATFDIAASMPDAIEAAQRQCPDLIIADHRIIDGTGADAVLTICSERAIPVVFVTSSELEVRKRIPDALIVDKPCAQPELEAAVIIAVERPFTHACG